MRITHWLVGCALCLAGVGSAAAVQLDARGGDSSMHTTVADSSAHDDGNRVSDDAPAPTADDPARDTSAAGSHRNGNDRSGGTTPAPTHPSRLHLGWQSLLPGSIQ